MQHNGIERHIIIITIIMPYAVVTVTVAVYFITVIIKITRLVTRHMQWSQWPCISLLLSLTLLN